MCGEVARVGDVMKAGETLAYETVFDETTALRSWFTWLGSCDDGRYEFALQQSIREKRGARWREVRRVDARLTTREDFTPCRLRVDVPEQRVEIDPARATVEVPGASPVTAPSGDPDVLVPAGATGCLALALALRRVALDADGECILTIFLPETLSSSRYALKREGGEWKSNFGEQLSFGADGFIDRIESPATRRVTQRIFVRPPQRRARASAARASGTKPNPAEESARRVSWATHGQRVEGLLRLPDGSAGPKLAAVFVGGSGSFDISGLVPGGPDLGYKRFCDRFAEQGIATLRFAKPIGAFMRDGSRPSYDAEVDVVRDAVACLAGALGRSRPAVALIGHSLGGVIAMEAALALDELAALALVATPALPLDATMRQQVEAAVARGAVSAEDAADAVARLDAFFDLVSGEAPWDEETVPPAIFVHRLNRIWYQEALRRDPAALASRMQVPVLVVQGGRDVQVPPGNARALAAAAPRSRLLTFPGHDHLLRRTRGDDPAANYHDRRRRPDPRAIDAVAQGLLALAAEHAGQ